MTKEVAYISVGSNLGQKLENCRRGIFTLTQGDDPRLLSISPFYRTHPVDYEDQDWFINAVFSIQTTLTPQALLQRTQEIQQSMGRKKSSIRFGPRTLDLDILLFGDHIIESSQLIIPHPRMHKRRFVLQPLCDMNPKLVHPILHCSIRTLLTRLEDDEQQVVLVDD